MDEMKNVDGMSDLSKEAAKLSKFLTDHIEKFACAFAKETGLDPTKIKMVQQEQRTGDGFGYKVWFEPFPSDSEIEMYRAGQERALVELAKAREIVEWLIDAGENIAGVYRETWNLDDEHPSTDAWDAAVAEWEHRNDKPEEAKE